MSRMVEVMLHKLLPYRSLLAPRLLVESQQQLANGST